MRRLLLCLLWAAVACRYNNADQKWGLYPDADGDGYKANVDCNDHNAAIHPGATETCDGQDDNCNGLVDDNAVDAPTWYVDHDGDGYAADGAASVTACTQPTGYAAQLGDCNDNDKTIHPGAVDIPDDGIDQDCNGFDTVTCWVDNDGDGYGDLSTAMLNPDGACDATQHQVANHDDCNDNSAATYPRTAVAAPDPWVAPQAGQTYEATDGCYTDADNDGYGADADHMVAGAKAGTDCDDAEQTAHPGGVEVVGDSIDQNCDQMLTCYTDADGDGHGTMAATDNTTTIDVSAGNCDQPALHAASTADDCDDSHPTVYPGAPELCDGFVSDCASWTDATPPTPPADEADGDGDLYVGCTFATITTAAGAPYTVTTSNYGIAGMDGDQDCNNDDPDTYPRTAVSQPDPWAAPAHGETYESTSGCYTDADNDGYGAETGFASGAIAGTDCDDAHASAYLGATEVIGNAIDEDCDHQLTCYTDADEDGYGIDTPTTIPASAGSCAQPSQHAAAVSGDCNDTSADTYPRVHVDTSVTLQPGDTYETSDGCYTDHDNDGYGAMGSQKATGAANGHDCDDNEPTAHPGGTEVVGNTIDEDCDGQLTCYHDGDADTWGANTTTTIGISNGNCDQPSLNAASRTGDCDDGNDTIYPGATELCDGYANDCTTDWSGTFPDQTANLPLDEIDNDGDGYVECTFSPNVTVGNWGDPSATGLKGGGDCNDDSIDTYPRTKVAEPNPWVPPTPGHTYESANGCYTDFDQDGFGADANDKATGADTGTDCDDTEAQVRPGAPDLCDGLQNNCSNWTGGTPNPLDETGLISRDNGDGTWDALTWSGAFNISTAGTYWLCDGTYNVSPTVTVDGVSIIGRNGAANTVIDGQSSARDLEVNTSGTTLVRGLTLDHGTKSGGGGVGGALYVHGGGTTTIDQCVVKNSVAGGNGGGLYVDTGTVHVTSTTFGNDPTATTSEGNSATTGLGGNVYVKNGTVDFDSASNVYRGTALQGGGIYVEAGSGSNSVTVSGHVAGNTATGDHNTYGDGAGIYFAGHTLILAGAVLDGNDADYQGGGVYFAGTTLTSEQDASQNNTVIENNTAGQVGTSAQYAQYHSGAGLEIRLGDGGTATLTDTDCTGNGAQGDGGGIDYSQTTGTGSLTLTGVTLDTNHSIGSGGGLYQYGGSVTTQSLTLTGNTADLSGGGVFQDGGQATHTGLLADNNTANGGSYAGGGAYAIDSSGTVTFNTSTLQNNTATINDGGALLAVQNCTDTVSNPAVTFNDSEVKGNTAGDQGGAFRTHAACHIVVNNTLVHDNTGAASGGVDLLAGGFTCDVTDTGIGGGVYANTATDTGDAGRAGGARIDDGVTDTATRVTSNGCDWGDTGNADDNSPYDLTSPSPDSPFTFSGIVTFVCTYLGCN